MYCIYCGKKLLAGAVFCQYCGKKSVVDEPQYRVEDEVGEDTAESVAVPISNAWNEAEEKKEPHTSNDYSNVSLRNAVPESPELAPGVTSSSSGDPWLTLGLILLVVVVIIGIVYVVGNTSKRKGIMGTWVVTTAYMNGKHYNEEGFKRGNTKMKVTFKNSGRVIAETFVGNKRTTADTYSWAEALNKDGTPSTTEIGIVVDGEVIDGKLQNDGTLRLENQDEDDFWIVLERD